VKDPRDRAAFHPRLPGNAGLSRVSSGVACVPRTLRLSQRSTLPLPTWAAVLLAVPAPWGLGLHPELPPAALWVLDPSSPLPSPRIAAGRLGQAGSLELGVLSAVLPVAFGLYPPAGLVVNSLMAWPDGVSWWEGSAEPRALLSRGRHQAGAGSFQPKPTSPAHSVPSAFSLPCLSPHP